MGGRVGIKILKEGQKCQNVAVTLKESWESLSLLGLSLIRREPGAEGCLLSTEGAVGQLQLLITPPTSLANLPALLVCCQLSDVQPFPDQCKKNSVDACPKGVSPCRCRPKGLFLSQKCFCHTNRLHAVQRLCELGKARSGVANNRYCDTSVWVWLHICRVDLLLEQLDNLWSTSHKQFNFHVPQISLSLMGTSTLLMFAAEAGN